MSISPSLAVSMMIGTLLRLRSARQTSVPDRPGQHQVEQDDVGAAAVELGQRVRAGAGDDGLEALPAQHVGQRVGEGLLVLHHQHSGHEGSFSSCSRAAGRRRCAAGQRDAQGERRAEALLAPDAHRAAVVARHVLDDRQARGRCRRCCWPGTGRPGRSARRRGCGPCAGCRCRCRSRRSRRTPTGRGRRRRSGSPRAVGDGVGQQVGHGGGQLALHAAHDEPRLAADGDLQVLGRAPPSGCGRPPRRARRRRRPGTSSGSGSPPCSRDRSMSSRTSRPSRSASCAMRPAKRCTASGSSAACSIASARRASAPTGVFSSCPTLATKSRRTASDAAGLGDVLRARARPGRAAARCRCAAGRRARRPAGGRSRPGRRAGGRRRGGCRRRAPRCTRVEQVGDEQPGAAHDAEGAGGGVGQQHRVVDVDEDDGGVHEVQQPAREGRPRAGPTTAASAAGRRDRGGSGG